MGKLEKWFSDTEDFMGMADQQPGSDLSKELDDSPDALEVIARAKDIEAQQHYYRDAGKLPPEILYYGAENSQ